jgi:hypothetical protein
VKGLRRKYGAFCLLIRNIWPTYYQILEIMETGHLRRIDIENSEEVQVIRLFKGVYGVGTTTAQQWYAAGCRTLNDVIAGKEDITLSSAQKIGIQFYEGM